MPDRIRGAENIVGTVIDGRSQQPLEDASISITRSPAGHRDIAALTDEEGHFAIRGVPRGHYTVKVQADGYGPLTAVVEAIPNPTKVVFLLYPFR